MRSSTEDSRDLVRELIRCLREAGATCAVAESCTGGLLSAAFVREPGVSDVFRGGVVAYADDLKRNLLGVTAEVLAANGAVSGPVARSMAEGVREMMGAEWAASITGVAGPTGGSRDKPVGTVWIGVAGPGDTSCFRSAFPGDRAAVQAASVCKALQALLSRVRD